MNTIFLEIYVLILGLGLLLIDLWTAPERKRWLGYGAVVGLTVLFFYSLTLSGSPIQFAFPTDPFKPPHSYVLDPLALFFKWFFLLAAIFVLIIAVDFSDRIET